MSKIPDPMGRFNEQMRAIEHAVNHEEETKKPSLTSKILGRLSLLMAEEFAEFKAIFIEPEQPLNTFDNRLTLEQIRHRTENGEGTIVYPFK